ncbi:hypothetical protein [Phaeacidiphilus oryzae]|uniref:hypothetical protein n=1 Tax=Phaeacidiphilus oryzae TaxID=348818 RepID=UPI00056CC4F2|nr:hypothetical protein [Phaeacidiphilus oryzae]
MREPQEAADAASEAIRRLSYRAIDGTGDWSRPEHAYAVLCSLTEMAQRLPHALHLVNAFLLSFDQAGQLTAAEGHPTELVVTSSHALGEASALAQMMAEALESARDATRGLSAETG